MERRQPAFRPRLLAPLLLGIALATSGCGGDDKDDGNKLLMQGNLIGALHGELAPALKDGLGLEPALADLNTPVETLDDVVILSDPNGVARPHPGLALLKQAYESGRAIAIERVKAEEVQALLDTLGKRMTFTLPDGLEHIDLFAARRAGGDNWYFIESGGAVLGDEDDKGRARNERRVHNFVAWLKETKAADAKATASDNLADDDLQKLAEANIYDTPFYSDYSQTFTLRYTVYACHSFTNNLDWYFVTQSAQLNPSSNWKNEKGQPGYGIFFTDEYPHQWGQMRRYIFKNYWQKDPGNGVVPLDKHAPQTANNVTTISSGVSWQMGGAMGFSGKSATGSLSIGAQFSHSESFSVSDVAVNDISGSEGKRYMAAWEYKFADPANGYSYPNYTDLKDAPLLARSNFAPVNQWIWSVPSDFSKTVTDFLSDFTWINGESWGAHNILYIPTKQATHQDYQNNSRIITVPIESPPLLAISPGQLEFGAAGDSQRITIVSALDWTATSNADWISVQETSGAKTDSNGKSIHITAITNDSGENRKDTVTLRSTDGTELQTLTVFQSSY